MSEIVAIDKIDRGAGTQSRAGLHGPTVYDYEEAMKAGDKFPPIELIYDGENYYLKDGFHRVAAAIQAGLKTIEANVEQGTLQDAQWASYAVNATHGLRRSREDTRRAITAALKHPNGAGKSDRQIGRHIGVDGKTVATVREQLQMTAEIPQSEERTGGDGRTINTANIGQSSDVPSLNNFPQWHSYMHDWYTEYRKNDPETEPIFEYAQDHFLELNGARWNNHETEHFNFHFRGGSVGLASKMTRVYVNWLIAEFKARFKIILVADLPFEMQIIVKKALLARGELNDVKPAVTPHSGTLEERFPYGSYVWMRSNRVKKVCGHEDNQLLIADPLLPDSQPLQALMVDKSLRLATDEEIEAYCHPPFPVGSKVIVDGSSRESTVVDTLIGFVTLLSQDGKQPFTVRLDSVHAATERQESTPSFDAQRNALERAYLYRGNEDEGWHRYAFGNYQGREGLDLLIQDGLIEVQHHQTPKEKLRITAKGCDLLGKPLASWMNDQPEFVYGDGTPLTQADIDQRNADVLAAIGIGDDDDGPYNNGTLDDYNEDDEQSPQLPPAPYRLDRKLHGGLAIFDGDGHSFMYFVGLSEEAEKQLGTSIVEYLNRAIAGQLSIFD